MEEEFAEERREAREEFEWIKIMFESECNEKDEELKKLESEK